MPGFDQRRRLSPKRATDLQGRCLGRGMMSIFNPLRWGAVALDVLAADRATPQALQARQDARLSKLLDVASKRSRFYSEHWEGNDVLHAKLSDLPAVSKQALMSRFDDWVTDPQLKLEQLRGFIADPQRIGEPFLGKYLVWESSGTSQHPGLFVQDAQSMAVYDALEALRRDTPRPLQRWLDPLMLSERIAFIGATTGHFASMVSMQRLKQLNPVMARCTSCFSILQPARALVDELNAFAPTVIASYPTVATWLADESCRGNLNFSPKEVWTGGETLSPTMRQRLVQVFGCTVRNSYGASEFMSIGWECGHAKMHANSDWVILEPIEKSGEPTPKGQFSYSTLVTNLANHVQPLIRYDLGDQLMVSTAACSCGSPLPVIEVQGRRDDPLVMAGVDGKPVTLLPLALTTVIEDHAGIFDFQLRQHDDHTLVLRLDLQGAPAEKALARCRTALENFAAAQSLAQIRVFSEVGKAVPRGRSGKIQKVIAKTGLSCK